VEKENNMSKEQDDAEAPTGLWVCHTDGTVEDYEDWCDTAFGPQISAQAWSVGAQPPQPLNFSEHHPWRKALAWSGVVAGLGAMVALLVVIGGGLTKADDHNSWPADYTPPPPVKEVAAAPEDLPPLPPFVPNWSVADHKTADGDFLQAVRAANWVYDNPAAAIADAHEWCRAMRQYGVSPAYVARALDEQFSGQPGYPDYPTHVKIVNAAVAAYCPDRA
jgi:hypothetical protein